MPKHEAKPLLSPRDVGEQMSLRKQEAGGVMEMTPDTLPAFPNGWFVIATSAEVRAGKVLRQLFMGHELVVFRTTAGVACVVDAHCPHNGAHLGYGGTVSGETIRCPFHGFCFDVEGRCVATGYATRPPPRCRLRSWPLHEMHGVILVYHDSAGRDPTWTLPTLDMNGWSAPLFYRYRLRTHPQETSENSVDIGHFSHVHGFADVATVRPLAVAAHYLNTHYSMTRPVRVLGRALAAIPIEFAAHVYGLGYSLVDALLPTCQLRLRHFVLATPIDGINVDLRIGVSLDERAAPLPQSRWLFGVRRALSRLITSVIMKMFKRDVEADFAIWEHKRYLQHPRLARGDGPIGLYRKWAAQFYSKADDEGASASCLSPR